MHGYVWLDCGGDFLRDNFEQAQCTQHHPHIPNGYVLLPLVGTFEACFSAKGPLLDTSFMVDADETRLTRLWWHRLHKSEKWSFELQTPPC